MKKFIIIALIIGFASACTKSSIRYEQPGEISFRPVTAMTTKAAVAGIVYPEESTFRVWALWGDVAHGTALENFPVLAEMYLNKQEFEYKEEGNSWGGKDFPYFWPTRGSLIFAGYSPADANAQNFSYSWGDKTMTIYAYEQSNDISRTNDLMWFDVTTTSYSTYPIEGVPVTFKHLLSWLTFRFQKKEGASSSYIVTDVTLLGIETKARFTSRPASGNEEWSDQIEPKSVAVWNGNQEVSAAEAKVLESTPGGVLVIPQPCTAEHVQLQVKYKASEGGPEQTKVVYLTAGADGHIWKPGKHYTYTITFGNNEILVLPEVTDWETVSVDIEVQ